MADVWRARVPRGERRDRSLGTIDGRLVEASRVPQQDETRQPRDQMRNINFNSGPQVTNGEFSPPYAVNQEGIIVGMTLITKTGSVTADLYINQQRRATLSNSGAGSVVESNSLNLGVEQGDLLQIVYTSASSTTSGVVTTVNLLED